MSFNNTSDEAPFRHENPERVEPESFGKSYLLPRSRGGNTHPYPPKKMANQRTVPGHEPPLSRNSRV